MQIVKIFFMLSLLLPVQAWAYDVNEALGVAKEHKNAIDNTAGINARIIAPATSDSVSFSTYDGKQTFNANLTCPNQFPAVIVSATTAAGGELNLHVQYDADLDGILEGQVRLNNVGGMCADGVVKGCSPSGSWRGCNYCQWVFEDGKIQNVCTKSTTDANGTSESAIAPESLKGCFCFNDSCGAPTVDLLENILSFTAKGVMDLLQKQNNLLILTKVEYEEGDYTLTYMGSKVSDCDTSSLSNDEVNELKGLYGQVLFPTDEAVTEALDDPSSPYSTVAKTFDKNTSSLVSCNMYAQVGVEMRSVRQNFSLKFGIGLDDHGYGNSSQCYWGGTGGYNDCEMGLVLEECGSWNACVGAIVPDKLQSICHYFLVNTGYFTSITGASNASPASGIYDIYGCYGGGNTSTDQYWTVDCQGVKEDNVFICRSPSMYKGETIVNDPYNPELYSGCGEVAAPLSNCDVLESRKEAGECTIETEIVDGIYTIKNGSRTGMEAPRDCRVFETGSSINSAIAVCEPWWEINRVYRCEGEEQTTYNFDNIKERTEYIGENTDYDEKTGLWSSTSDMGWDESGTATNQVYDVNIEFDTEYDVCIPACKVERQGTNTNIYVPAATVNEDTAGSYTGESTWTYDRNTTITEMKECVQDDNAEWSCPLEAGETKVSGCICYDEASFVDAIFQLQIINQASSDIICSGGTEQGTCVEDIDTGSAQVVCGKFDFSNAGIIDISKQEVYTCNPKLWKGSTLASQNHLLTINENLQCSVSVGNSSLAQLINEEISTIVPSESWFADMISWAKQSIITTLQNDKDLAPLPEMAGVCDSSSCTWTLGSSVNDIKEEYNLVTNSKEAFPFGFVDLKIDASGTWTSSDGTIYNAKPNTYTFRVGVVINNNSFEQKLYLVQNNVSKFISSSEFTNSNVFINECLDKYTEPYLNFTDDSIGGDFIFSFADELIYQIAANRDELPSTVDHNGVYTLPVYPAVYRAAAPISDDDISTVVTSVPNSPMFFEKKMVANYDNSGLFGQYSISFTNLYPYVYYWECPEGSQVKSKTNTCGADTAAGTGGVFDTIDDKWCFQYACDTAAVVNSDAINEGCGYADDGDWK